MFWEHEPCERRRNGGEGGGALKTGSLKPPGGGRAPYGTVSEVFRALQSEGRYRPSVFSAFDFSR
jgi:hypothetical protein